MVFDAIINKPMPKFVLIQDTYEHKQNRTLNNIIDLQSKKNQLTVQIFSFENQLENDRTNSRIIIHRMGDSSTNRERIMLECQDISEDCVLVIDSLIDLIYNHGEAFCIKKIQELLNNTRIHQIVAVLHRDLCEHIEVTKHFSFLSSLNILALNEDTLQYTHKKSNGKVVKKTVKLIFKNGQLQVREMEKIKAPTASETSTVQPENLTTFKIGLEENEIQSRNKLVLPYLRTEEKGKPLVTIGSDSSGGKIIYMPDENDDFDEEDPDDDLDV